MNDPERTGPFVILKTGFPCSRCGKLCPFAALDYCAACYRDLCASCMKAGCCGRVPASSAEAIDQEAEKDSLR